MRTEQEIKNRIHELEEVMNTAIKNYYRGNYNGKVFKEIYSDVWDEMKVLYWILGNSSIEATKIVAGKVTRMIDEIKVAMTE